jgi:hypothetical protein
MSLWMIAQLIHSRGSSKLSIASHWCAGVVSFCKVMPDQLLIKWFSKTAKMMNGKIRKDLHHLVPCRRLVCYARKQLTTCDRNAIQSSFIHAKSRFRAATISKREFQSTTLVRNNVNEIEIILKQFHDKTIDIQTTQKLLLQNSLSSNRPTSPVNDELLQSFATLDHDRTDRTGFPEVVFGQGKTAKQVASILEDMARNVNEIMSNEDTCSKSTLVSRAILATR